MELKSQNNNVKEPDTNAEIAIVSLLSDMFSDIAYMDSDTVRENVVLAAGGMSLEDRSIRLELGNYLMSHFALIFTGLIVNKDFRNAFMEAVSVELALEERDEAFVKKIRNDMRDSKDRESKGNFVLDFSSYNDKIFRKVSGKLSDSFEKVEPYADVIDSFAAELTDDDKIGIGYCTSNFMYLFRAFSQNALFTNYVKSVVHTVEKQLEIS